MWYGIYGTNGSSDLKEHEIPLKKWIEKLKQFVDLPTEYPEEWEKRTDIQIYLEAIHELDNESLYWMLVWVNSQIEETPLGFYWRNMNNSPNSPKVSPIRSITVLDAFIIREYVNRLLVQKRKEQKEKKRLESKRSAIYKEEWYKNFDDKFKYRLETAVEHRIEQRMYEEQGDETNAAIAYNNFHKALAYEQTKLKRGYFADEFFDYSQKRNLEQQLFKQDIKRRGK